MTERESSAARGTRRHQEALGSEPRAGGRRGLDLEGRALWGYRLYQAAAAGGLALASPYLARRGRSAPREMRERRGQWGPLPDTARGAVWIHAASMGEARGALTLVEALSARGVRTVMSVMTPAARELESAARAAGCEALRFVPLDVGPYVRRVLEGIEPRALLICETEIWPGLLAEARRSQVPVAFVSARLTDRGARRQRLWQPLVRELMRGVPVAAQSGADAERWRAIGAGAACVAVTGNLKYHHPAGPLAPAEREAGRRGWNRVFVLGSVRSGEFEAVVSAVARTAERVSRAPESASRTPESASRTPESASRTPENASRTPENASRTPENASRTPENVIRAPGNVLVVVVPRHPERAGDLWDGLGRLGMPVIERRARKGQLLPAPGAVEQRDSTPTLLAVHTIGELRDLYALADAAFVGGTLAPIGGHSLYEVAEWGVPVLYGPHVEQVADVAAALEARGGGRRVHSAEALAEAWTAWMTDPAMRREAAAAALEAARELGGSAERTLGALAAWGFPVGEQRTRQGPDGDAYRETDLETTRKTDQETR